MIRVFIADDHAVVRDGLRLLLRADADLAVVGEAGNGREAVAEVARLRPDVMLLDLAMPELNGIEVARQIGALKLATRIIVLSMYGTSEHLYQALRAGVVGFVVKESAGAEVVKAIRAVYAGQRHWSASLAAFLEEAHSHARPFGEASPLERLSPREREVLQLVVEGKTSAAIAVDLGLSPKTVETYRSRLMGKIGVENVPQLVRFALGHVLTPPGRPVKPS